MRSSDGSDRQETLALYDEWEAINDKVAALDLGALTDIELLNLQRRREIVARRQPVVDHAIINRLAAEADPKALGGKNLADVLATKLDISMAEARRRIKYAELLGPRLAIAGEPMPPRLPNVAEAQARGQIGHEHVRVIEKFFDDLPTRVDAQTRDAAEADLAHIATGLGPKQFRAAVDRLALLLNQDGDLPNDADRARRRYLTIDKQDFDGMSRIHGLLDPEARATVEAVFAKLAAPGMCNPTTKPLAWTANRTKTPRNGICVARGNATMTRSRRWAAASWLRVSWASSTGCRAPSSCPPPLRSWNRGAGRLSPPAEVCCPYRM